MAVANRQDTVHLHRTDLDDIRGEFSVLDVDLSFHSVVGDGDGSVVSPDLSAKVDLGAGGDEFDASAGRRRGSI